MVIRVLPLARMSNVRWNDDVDYVFSAHRKGLGVFGLWPLETQVVFAHFRWVLSMILMFVILPMLLLDSEDDDTEDNNNANDSLEIILFFASTIVALTKAGCLGIYKKKLGSTINFAIDDWLSVKNDEETRKIMKKYALVTRVITYMMVYVGIACIILYVSGVVAMNLQQIFMMDPNSTEANRTNWVFMFPSGFLSQTLTGTQYIGVLILEILQTCSLCAIDCLVDSFYFNVILHLVGQLKLLKNKIEVFANEPDTEANYRAKFVSLIKRHSELMEYFEHLEMSFNILILCQLLVVTILLAVTGLHLDISLQEGNKVEMVRSVFIINFYLIASIMYTFGGDLLQSESEEIFNALYTTSWLTLPTSLKKDVHFAMMRSSIPFRLTGGKFFYVNREAMMAILKTAASYISVLRLAVVNA